MKLKINENDDDICIQDHSVQDFRTAIENLTDTDKAKLILSAKYYVQTRCIGRIVRPEDLLQEAILRTLIGKRKWKKGISILKHISQSMRSISSHEAEKYHVNDTISFDNPEMVEKGQDPVFENTIIFKEQIDNYLKLFQYDKIALKIINLKIEGYVASEIKEKLSIDNTTYDSAIKQIKRKTLKFTMKGVK